ncbi:MAG: SusC/RagA family TonB-linked outer membrane protein, partial [Bacteroidota bacterium]
MKRLLLFVAVGILSFSCLMAQKTISGTVTDAVTQEPVEGAAVLIKGTTIGAYTDGDGAFSILAPDDATILLVTFVGKKSVEREIGSNSTMNFELADDFLELDEVVVTALGIQRDEKALGYAVQKVDGDVINRSGATNPVDALVGKAAGVQITRSSGSVGGGSRILIRGVTSMIGNNQPLVVIDGVRVNNETLLSQASTAGTAASNRLMDLNPEDIETINVLKGAAATALYGTAGSTGVILITTKKGQNNSFSVDFSTSVSFDNITQMIDLQDEFAQGRLDANGVPFYRDPSTGESGSWGPRMSDLEFSTDPNHPNAPPARAFGPDGSYLYDNNGFLVPAGTGNGVPANVYDNVDPFYQTGNQFNNSLAISGGNQLATFRLSISDLRSTGVVPNEEYDRTTIKLASTLNPIEGLKISGSFNYTKSDYIRVQQGSNTSGLLLGQLRTPSSFDNTNGFSPEDAVDQVTAYQFADFSQRNYRGGGGYDNPYWIVNNALGFEDVNRLFGNVKFDYTVNNWVGFGLNIGYDVTTDIRKQEFEINSRTNAGGAVEHNEFNTQQYDLYLNMLGSGDLTEQIGLSYVLGVNAFNFENHRTETRGDGLVFPGFIDLSNATQISGFEDITRFRQLGFFASLELDWRNIVYLTATARQDYDSRLGNPSDFDLGDTGFFYPSVSLSFAFSELLPESSVFSFGKIRLSYAQVGSPPPNAYSTASVFVSPSIGDGWGDNIGFPINGVSGFDQSSLLGNGNLTPELSTTYEVGLDLRFFEGRLGFDATYYRTETEDAILNASLTPSTGYTNAWLNAGEMTSQGVELTLNAVPFRTNNFEWNTQVNFTKSESIVDRLAPGVERLFLAGFNTAGTYLVEGNQYGAIFGGAYLRTEAGTDADQSLNIPGGAVVINDDINSSEFGYEAVDPTQRAIGNPNPDFIIGWNNTIRFQNFTFNFLIDWREGGDLWNGTAWALSFFGRSQLTAETRVEAPTPIEGVKSDGTPNDIPVVRDRN